MTKYVAWRLLCQIAVFVFGALFLAGCNIQAGQEGDAARDLVTPTPLASQPAIPTTLAKTPEAAEYPMPLPTTTSAMTMAAVTPEAAAEDHLISPTESASSPMPTLELEPVITPTIGSLDYISVTIPSPFTRLDEATVYDQRIFFLARTEPSTEYPLANAIFTHDLVANKTALLTTTPLGERGTLCCMAVSEEWLAWLTYYNTGGNWRVMARNLITGEEIIIDRAEDANYPTLRGPYVALSGDKLVWSSSRRIDADTVKSYVMLYYLTEGRTEIIAETTKPTTLGYVDIDGDQVVWSAGSPAGGKKADVFLYDLSTKKTTQITTDGQSGQPQIDGDYLVWRQGFADVGPIIIHNLITGERVRLSKPGGWVLLGDGLVIWHNWVGDIRVSLYDIENNIMESLVFIGDDEYMSASIFGRNIVLITYPEGRDWVNGTGQIEVRTYPPSPD